MRKINRSVCSGLPFREIIKNGRHLERDPGTHSDIVNACQHCPGETVNVRHLNFFQVVHINRSGDCLFSQEYEHEVSANRKINKYFGSSESKNRECFVFKTISDSSFYEKGIEYPFSGFSEGEIA